MRRTRLIVPLLATAATAAAVATSGGAASAAPAAPAPGTSNVLAGLNGPRGVVHGADHQTLITLADGTLRLAREHRHGAPTLTTLTSVPGADSAAVDQGRHHTTWLLTGGASEAGPPPAGAATLYRWKKGTGKPKAVADIAAYQAHDPDPYNLADPPTESNPYGVKALNDGSVLVADAANNDVLHVSKTGAVSTVARLKPRLVKAPDGSTVPSEAVPTSVAVGPGGYWYVGELRGGPGTAGTSQIWRIRPGSTNVVCDPAKPDRGDCRRYADGLSAIVGLDSYRNGPLYAVSMSKAGLAGLEGAKPDVVGGVYRVRSGDGRSVAVGTSHRFLTPGGVSVAKNLLYVTDRSLSFAFPHDGRLVAVPR